jgi:hypothetical protein
LGEQRTLGPGIASKQPWRAPTAAQGRATHPSLFTARLVQPTVNHGGAVAFGVTLGLVYDLRLAPLRFATISRSPETS